jgi:uncharacterized protein YutE (UPF0331/DUF86 family)
MGGLDRQVLAEKAAAVERHLRRVALKLPSDRGDFVAATDAADAVILNLWQAVQSVIDLALAACLQLGLGTPQNYGDAFSRLAAAGHLDDDLAQRLVQAAGFRNQIAHAYGDLDMDRVYRAATRGPDDLRAFLATLERLLRY